MELLNFGVNLYTIIMLCLLLYLLNTCDKKIGKTYVITMLTFVCGYTLLTGLHKNVVGRLPG
jgi:hypothetical protein